MESDSASSAPRKHANGWITVMALGLLAAGLLACLYVLIGFPAAAQEVSNSTPGTATASSIQPQPLRRQLPIYAAQAVIPPATTTAPQHVEAGSEEWQGERAEGRDELRETQENLREAVQDQHRIRIASALFLAVFAVIAALVVIQVYVQARAWDKDAFRGVAEVQDVATQLEVMRDVREEARNALPGLLQEVGEQPLSYQEEGTAFAPRASVIIDDIDQLAYIGHGRLAFRDLPSQPEAAVYLNGLLLSAASHLSRSDSW